MCRNLIFRYTCAHKHPLILSRCRHTKSKLKRDGQLSPLCQAWRDTSQALVLRLSTPCPSCLALIKLETRVPAWLRVAAGRETLRMQVWAKEVRGAKQVEALMRVMKLGEGDAGPLKRTVRSGDGVSYDRFGVNLVHQMGEEEVRRMEREEAAIVVRKVMLEPLCGKKVHGGSPLRFELKIEDLEEEEEEGDEERDKQEEEKEEEAEEKEEDQFEEEDQEKKEDETMSWPDASAKLSSSDREPVTPSSLKAKEEETETAKRQDNEMSDSLYFDGTEDVPWIFCLGFF